MREFRTVPGSSRAAAYRGLIHELNMRYHREWQRAELLGRPLTLRRAVADSRLGGWLRRVKGWLRPFAEAPLAERWHPYQSAASVTASPAARVGIVIPFKDRVELLRDCLRSLRATIGRRHEIVLVDNGSVEARTRRFLARVATRRGVKILDAPGPFNFARLCNGGAAAAAGDHLLFLNNDTEALESGWLDRMLALAAGPTVGAVGATLLYPDRTIQHAGVCPRADGVWVHPYRGQPEDTPGDGGELRRVRVVPAATAACLLVRRDHFLAVGGFDERYPTTFNDIDLCRRLRRRGLLVLVTPDAKLLHYESLSRGYSANSAGTDVQPVS